MKNSNPILWFVSLPQLLLTAALIASLAGSAHNGVLWMVIISVIVIIASAVYAFLRRKQPDKTALIALIVLSCFMLSASAFLLGGAATFGGFLSPKLISFLLCGIMALYAVFALAKSLTPNIDAGRHILALAVLPFAWFSARVASRNT